MFKKVFSVILAVVITIGAAAILPVESGAHAAAIEEQLNCIRLASAESEPTSHDYFLDYGHVSDTYLIQNPDKTLTRIDHYYVYDDEFGISGFHSYDLPLANDYHGNLEYEDPYLHDEQKILVETYSSDGKKLLNKRYIPTELERFSGFFSGEKYHFFVFCQNNLKNSDSVE